MNTIPYFQNMQHRLGPETQILLLNQGVSGTVNCYNILRRKGLRSQLFMGNLEFPRHAEETRQTNCLVSIKLARLKDSENSSHLSHTVDTLNMLETDLISVDKKELSLLLKDQLISASAIYIHMAREIIGAAVNQVDVLTFAKSKLGMSLVKDWEERVKHTAFFFPADTLVPLLYERLKWPKERLLEAIRADWISPTTKLQKKHFTEVMFSVFSNWKKLEGIMPILLSMYATGKGGNVRHDMFY
ncbi:hypothetical protein SJAG_04523 [Schizosaccharomyces japonicus yFS275]|uniref:Uncharacterized protein n=1 Tax=Schizosaccharomyces japonicus (strain yFS275 / FY16936) TaxID=402676 RepID=B6K720_SCHJY|nr:hypothetical protein SJAG_04523 [Schizosaccharomyces japonicus yFS275]EEB09324.1 hypothetical protein SJAG_04523 [Schizosaccharomyces japonicus yFS275]